MLQTIQIKLNIHVNEAMIIDHVTTGK